MSSQFEVLNYSFNPVISLITCTNVEKTISLNNITFKELLLPFSNVKKEFTFYDPYGVQLQLKNLRLNITEEKSQSSIEDDNSTSDILSRVLPHYLTKDDINSKKQFIDGSPWFNHWRIDTLKSFIPKDFDFWKKPVGTVIVLGCCSNLKACYDSQIEKYNKILESNLVNNPFKHFLYAYESKNISNEQLFENIKELKTIIGNANISSVSINSGTSDNSLDDPWFTHINNFGVSSLLAKGQPIEKPHDPLGEDCKKLSENMFNNLEQKHGSYLSIEDRKSISSFMETMVQTSMIPWVESTLKSLYEPIANKTKFSKNIFSVTKKLFIGSGPDPIKKITTVDPNRQSAEAFYTIDAPEIQMKKYADICLIMKQYDSAHQVYQLVKKDFNADNSWSNYVNVLFLSGVAQFFSGVNPRSLPVKGFESAISHFMQDNNLDTKRALLMTLISTEILKSLQLYSEAELIYLKFAKHNDYAVSGLMLEQSANCFLHTESYRKYAFRMILAAARYMNTNLNLLSLRCLMEAHQYIKDSKMYHAIDHLNYLIGSKYFELKEMESSRDSLYQLFQHYDLQSNTQQLTFLKDLINVSKHIANNEKPIEIPIPKVDKISVHLGQYDRLGVDPNGPNVDHDNGAEEEELKHLLRIFGHEKLLAKRTADEIVVPDWMSGTENSDSDTDEETVNYENTNLLMRWMYYPKVRRLSHQAKNNAILHRLIAIYEQRVHSADKSLLGSNVFGSFMDVKSRIYSFDCGHFHRNLVPVEEKLTVKITVKNNLSIDFKLKNVRLECQFLSEEHAAQEGQQRLDISTLDLIEMKANAFTSFELSVSSKDLGMFTIEALSFDFILTTDVERTLRGYLPLQTRGYKRGPVNELELKSEHILKEEEIDEKGRIVPYCDSRILQWEVCERMPCLKINFSSIQKTMLQGQIINAQLVLKNLSKTQRAVNIRYNSNWPGFLMCQPDSDEKFDIMLNKFPKDSIEPDEEYVLNVTIRAPFFSFFRKDNRLKSHSSPNYSDALLVPPSSLISDIYTKNYLFALYYQSENKPLDMLNYRNSLIELTIDIKPSLRFECVLSNGGCCKSEMHEDTEFLDLSVAVQHICPPENKLSVKFLITDVVCIDKGWEFCNNSQNLNVTEDVEGLLPREIKTFFFRLKRRSADGDSQRDFSVTNIVKSNAMDHFMPFFYYRSGTKWSSRKLAKGEAFPEYLNPSQFVTNSSTKKKSSRRLNFPLVFLWKFNVYEQQSHAGSKFNIDSNCHNHGQTTVLINYLNCPVRVPHSESKTAKVFSNRAQCLEQSKKSQETNSLTLPSNGRKSFRNNRLVKHKFNYPITHDIIADSRQVSITFLQWQSTKLDKSFYKITLAMKLYNPTEKKILVKVEAQNTPLIKDLDRGKTWKSILWYGKTGYTVDLSASQSKTIDLVGLATNPGCYKFNNIIVKVAKMDNDEMSGNYSFNKQYINDSPIVNVI